MISWSWLLAGTIVVSPTGPIASLSAALSRAHRGDTVLVLAGTYVEPRTLIVDQPITIRGEGDAIIDGGSAGDHTLVRVTADSVVIEGLTLRNVLPASTDDRSAIRVEGSRGAVIRNNQVRNTFFGIYLAQAKDCRVVGNVVQGPGHDEQQSGNAIQLWSTSGIEIADNQVSGHRDGIYLEFARHTVLTKNTSRANRRYGLHFMFSDSSFYRGNTFTENGAGVAVMYSKSIRMEKNRFLTNQGQAAYGLLLKDITDSNLTDNEIADNTVGLYLEGVNRLVAVRNRFQGNGWAARVLANSLDNRFEENSFVGNTFDLTTNSRSSSSTFRRNFWDQYRGYDLDRDGVGDVPYRPVRLFSLVVEGRPPALVLLRSPFVDLLDAAERVLPILTPESLLDREPLMIMPVAPDGR